MQKTSNKNTYSVTEISSILKNMLEKNFNNISVEGEISSFKEANSGHAYFSLKDEEAVLNGICWKQNFSKIPIKLEDGLMVVCSGKLSSYPARSNYQLIIEEIKLAGQGKLLAMLEERKAKLEKEGLFNLNLKKMLPKIPEKVGIITSIKGSVIKDIIHRIKERFPMSIIIYDAQVQGKQSADSIKDGIEKLNNLPNHIKAPEVIIIARGGGSIEDLWSFNEEILVRAVVKSNIPIISAIGHETDVTLIDFAADLRAPTPTAAAELITSIKKTDVRDSLQRYCELIKKSINKRVLEKQNLLQLYTSKFANLSMKFKNRLIYLENLENKMLFYFSKIYQIYITKLQSIQISHNLIQRYLSIKNDLLQKQYSNFKNCHENYMRELINRNNIAGKMLLSFNYKNILKRGFSIIRDNNKNHINSKKTFYQSEKISIEFHDGKIKGKFVSSKKRHKKSVIYQPNLFDI